MVRQGEAARNDRVSIWMASAEGPHIGQFSGSSDIDVAVVGGGIVGLTTALRLIEAGREVAVLEGAEIAAGVSGYTTAKLTAGHGLIYSHLQSLRPETARLYGESQMAGLSAVLGIAERYGIDCDLERVPNYVCAESEDDLEKLEAEAQAARQAGLAVELTTDVKDAPFPIAGALRLEEQAQFHPRKYLLGVARAILDAGASVFERSRVVEITGQGPYVVKTAEGELNARALVVATHYPIVEQGFFVNRIHPRRSYVVAARLRTASSHGMFINVGSPTRSVRTTLLSDGERLLLVGGEGHRVGQETNTAERYEKLELFMNAHFSVGETLFRWSTQDNHSVDRLPYIGRLGNEGELYTATGFAGWGMTNGTAAGLIITDLIEGHANQWSDVFDPQRPTLAAAASQAFVESANVATHELRGKLASRDELSIEKIKPGEGAIVELNGAQSAVSRDSSGEIHVLSAKCTHMGCTVTWNDAESTWDCPCHGSRFAADGQVLHGPALHPLEALPRQESPS